MWGPSVLMATEFVCIILCDFVKKVNFVKILFNMMSLSIMWLFMLLIICTSAHALSFILSLVHTFVAVVASKSW